MSVPLFSSNLVVQLDDSSIIWKDNAKTISATTAGDVVNVIQDASGNGNDCTIIAGRTGAILQPTYTNGKRGYIFSTSNVYSLGTPATLVATLNTTSAWTVFWFGIPTNAAGFVFSKMSGGGGRVNVGLVGGQIANGSLISSVSSVPLSGNPVSCAYSPLDATYSKGAKVYLNGSTDYSSNTVLGTADVTNPIGFGGQGGAPTNAAYQGSINAFLVYNRILHDPEVMQLSDYYFTYYGIANPRKTAPFYIVWHSNSISVYPGSTGSNIPTNIQTTLGMPQGSLVNLSIPGKTGSQITAEAPINAWPLVPLLKEGKPIIYCGYEITNEAGIQGQGGINSLQNCVAAKQQGFDRVVTATATSGQTLGILAPSNGYVRSNWQTTPSSVDGLIDYAADPIVGLGSNWITGGYYSGDGLHPNVNGVPVLANVARPIIKAVAYATNCVRVTISAITTTTCTVTCSAPVYGTGPYNLQFQQAPDVSGQPGTWANIGTNTSALTNAVTGLTQNTPYWFRAVTVDTGSTRVATTLWETATTSGAAATAYTITGPASGPSGIASTAFTVTPNGAVSGSDSVTLAITGGGSCTPASLSFPSGSVTPLTFTYTPTTVGSKSIAVTSATLALTVTGTPITYTANSNVATGYYVTGPNAATTATASTNFTFSPNGVATDTITLPAAFGTWTPTTLTFSGSTTPQTATFTPTGTGTKALTFTTSISSSTLNFSILGLGVISGWYLYSVPASTTYTVTGSSSLNVGSTTITFTVTPSASISDTVIFDDQGAGGSFSPSFMTFSSSAVAQTTNYTARTVSVGAKPLRFYSATYNTITGSPYSVTRNTTAASKYAVTPPLSGVAGVPSQLWTLTPNGVVAGDTVTLSDGGAGGVFNVSSLVWSASALIQTFTYAPPASGVYTVTMTSSTPLTFYLVGPATSQIAGGSFVYSATTDPNAGGTVTNNYIFSMEG